MNRIKHTKSTYAKSTFIPINRCMCCDKVCYKTNTIVYAECHPRRMVVYCNSQECFLSALKTFLTDMIKENKYPFFERRSSNIKVLRTNNEYSVGKVTQYPLILHKNMLYVECYIEDYSSCETTIEKILNDENYKPFFSLKKMVDASLCDVTVLKLFKMYSTIKDF